METLLVRATRFLQPGENKLMGRAASLNSIHMIDGMNSKTLNRTLTKTKDQPFSFGIGEVVNVLTDKEKVKGLQMFHDRWIEDMDITIGREGVVRYISHNGEIGVEIEGVRWFFNPKCLTKEDFCIGDTVKVIEDENKARRLQYGLGEWSNSLYGILGKKGQVVNIYTDGCVEVHINDKSWAFNPKCLVKKPEIVTYTRDDPIKVISNGDMLKMIQGIVGWKEGMEKLSGKHGRVIATLPNKEIEVKIEEVRWVLSYKCIYKSKEPIIKCRVGDHVRVNENEETVRNLQEISRIWIEAMNVTLGKKGIISRVYRDGTIRVEIEGNEWNFNSKCLSLCN
ncbi:hypothetical protein LOD99_6735 [Oopsacas minuta]|uniref:Mind bomb SH3 repeat domain-containing protein n=1 Tax=Oopsacas minuta TaxID=111878 RepID=A0AAV7JMB8_9METZ|nr:hypothetical protein LOD99_6735 [Oopsacas minuta]